MLLHRDVSAAFAPTHRIAISLLWENNFAFSVSSIFSSFDIYPIPDGYKVEYPAVTTMKAAGVRGLRSSRRTSTIYAGSELRGRAWRMTWGRGARGRGSGRDMEKATSRKVLKGAGDAEDLAASKSGTARWHSPTSLPIIASSVLQWGASAACCELKCRPFSVLHNAYFSGPTPPCPRKTVGGIWEHALAVAPHKNFARCERAGQRNCTCVRIFPGTVTD